MDLNEVERLKEFVSKMSLEDIVREIICDLISTDEIGELIRIRLADYNVEDDGSVFDSVFDSVKSIREEICPDDE